LRARNQLMPHPPHLLVAISSHGFGHLSQVAPVVNRLHALIPQLKITVRAALPEAQLRSRIHHLDNVKYATDDFGMVMNHAFSVDTQASLARYESLHQDWDDKVNALAQQFIDSQVDVVLADVPYLPLAAAQVAGIPAIALCSLNWADILSHYVGLDKQQAIINSMYAAYQSARYFLQPAPSMAMPKLESTRHRPLLRARCRAKANSTDHRSTTQSPQQPVASACRHGRHSVCVVT